MVEVYGKKARQKNAQDPALVNVQRSQCKENKERSGGKERMKKNFQSQGGESNPQPSP